MIARLLEGLPAMTGERHLRDLCDALARHPTTTSDGAPDDVSRAVADHLIRQCRSRDRAVQQRILTAVCAEAGLWDLAQQSLRQTLEAAAMAAEGPTAADTALVNSWLQCCGTHRRFVLMREAEALMAELSIPPDAVTFVILLERGPQAPAETDRIEAWLQDYAATIADDDAVGHRSLNAAFGALLAARGRARDWAAVDRCLRSAPGSADLRVAAVSLYGLVAKDFVKMEQAMVQMKADGFTLSDSVVCIAIEAYGRRRAVGSLRRLLATLQAEGRTLSGEVFAALAVAYARLGRLADLQALVADMGKQAVVLGDKAFLAVCFHVVSYHGNRRDFPMVDATLAELAARRIPLSPGLRERVLSIYSDALHLERLRKFVGSIWPLSPPEVRIAAKAFEQSGLFAAAEQVRRGQRPDPPTSDGPGLTPARRQWLAWRLLNGRFIRWCSEIEANGSQSHRHFNDALEMDGKALGVEEMEYAVTFFRKRPDAAGLAATLRIIERYGIPVAAEVLSDSKQGWTGPPDPDTMTAPHTAVAYLTT